MGKYIVIEMQNGIIGSNSWAYDDRPSAEVKLYQVLSEVVKSPVETHTVMLVTNDGFVLDVKSYNHPVQPEPTPEPEPEPTPEPETDSKALPADDGTNAQATEEAPSESTSEGEGA